MPAKMVATPTSTGDFIILPLSLPVVPSFPVQATHYLYIRPHAPKNPTSDEERLVKRQLFIANVPVDSGVNSIKTLFKTILGEAGRVVDVRFDCDRKHTGAKASGADDGEAQLVKAGAKRKRDIADLEESLKEEAKLPSTWGAQLRDGGSSAVVLFVDANSAEAALKAVKKRASRRDEVPWTGEGETGERRYKTHHALTYPSPDALTAHINDYLTTHTALQSLRNKSLRKLALPDEDGFVTVTRQGSRAAPASLAAAEAAKAKEDERRKKAAEEMTNFYRFQGREKRKEREVELKRRFEEDRRKVAGMRMKRARPST